MRLPEGVAIDPSPLLRCVSCHQYDQTCPGHFGHIRLDVPVFQPMLYQLVFNVSRRIQGKEFEKRWIPVDEGLLSPLSSNDVWNGWSGRQYSHRSAKVSL